MNTRIRMLAASAVAIVALLAAPATSAMATAPTVGYQGIDATIKSSGAVGLVFSGSDWHADYIMPPKDIPNGGATGYALSVKYASSLSEDGAYGTAKARIYDKGKPSLYWVKMYASVWLYPYDEGACEISLGDPDVAGTLVDFSPYTCAVSSVEHSDPWKITFDIEPVKAIPVTDKDSQAQLLNQACNQPDSEANCVYKPSSVEILEDKPQPFGDPVSNPTDDFLKTTVKSERKFSESNSIGVEYSNELKLWKIWTQTLTVSYEHTWTDTRTFSQAVEVDVRPGTQFWFTIAAQLNKITGDFLVRSNGQVYSISNATVIMPDATKSAVITGHSQPIASQGKNLGSQKGAGAQGGKG